ncbi:MAG: hypothetical protein ACLQUY_24740 [Ktedonobacterales bacterium]
MDSAIDSVAGHDTSDIRDPSKDPLPLHDFYGYTVRRMERVESLINRRIAWTLAFQGLLLVSVAILANTNPKSSIYAHLALVVPILGMMVGVLTFIGILGAYLCIFHLQDSWDDRSSNTGAVGLRSSYPSFTTPLASLLDQWLGLGLPLLFVAAWLVLLLLRL